MLTIIQHDKVPTIQLSDLSFTKLAIIFCELPAPEQVYILAGKQLIGTIFHTEFIKNVSLENEILKLLRPDYERIIKDSDYLTNRNRMQTSSLLTEAAQFLLQKPNCNEIAIISPAFELLAVCRRKPIEEEKQSYKMLTQWLELAQRRWYCIGSYLKCLGYKRIAVYAEDAKSKREHHLIDALLVQELKYDNNIQICYLITDTMTTLGDIPNINVSQIENLNDIDAILVPRSHLMETVIYMIGSKTSVPVLSLSKIINEIYVTEVGESNFIETLYNLQERGSQVLFFMTPIAKEIKNRSVYEQFLVDNQLVNLGRLLKKIDDVFPLLGLESKDFEKEYLEFVRHIKTIHVSPYKNYWHSNDHQSVFRNVLNHQRLTTGTPKKFVFSIHLFGDSVIFNGALKDVDTTTSCLQRLLNAHFDYPVRVVNHAMVAASLSSINNRIKDTEIGSSDIVVVVKRKGRDGAFLEKSLVENRIPFYYALPDYQRPHEMGELFLDAYHPNWRGCQLNAEIIFQKLFTPPPNAQQVTTKPEGFKPYFRSADTPKSNIPVLEEWYDPIAQGTEFLNFINDLKAKKRSISDGKIGSIVMNCNPFTNGHLYLIEHCAKEVDYLYIFVVEEDRSVFPFADRFELVQKGVAYLKNIEILRSGAFIISTLTFPEYFVKGDLQQAVIDPSGDVELFGQYIAPALNINIRFAGEEPLDNITRQYNNNMKNILPKFGIKFVEILRKNLDGEPISASRVRKYLNEKNFEEVKRLVPKSTLDYLIENIDSDIEKVR